MPEAVLETDIVEETSVLDENPFLFVVDDNDDDREYEEFTQAIADIEAIIHFLEYNKVSSIDSIKGSLLNIDVIYNYFQKHFPHSKNVSQMKNFLSQEGDKVLQLIYRQSSKEDVLRELKLLLNYVVDTYKNEKKTMENSSELEVNPNLEEKQFAINDFILPKVDQLYEQLYNAIKTNDFQKETLLRGRIIRELSKNKKRIHQEYEQFSVLVDISKILVSNSPDSFAKIKELLSREDNKKFFDYFSNSMNSIEDFQKSLILLFQNPSIMKILFYEYALREETKTQGKKLKDRYSKEFLDKKADVTSIVTLLPNAVGLSVQKLANTITELQEARTKRKKVSKFLETLKDAGRVLATPIIYAGKFAVNNWYVLYKLYDNIQDVKPVDQNDLNHSNELEKNSLEKENVEESLASEVVENPEPQVDVVPAKEDVPTQTETVVDTSSVEEVPENVEKVDHLSRREKPHLEDPIAKPNAKIDELREEHFVLKPKVEQDVQIDPSTVVDVNPNSNPEPQPDPDPQPAPVIEKPVIELNPMSNYEVPLSAPNPWGFEAVCDPRSESFIVLPSFLIDLLGIRDTVDVMNDMAIYHNYDVAGDSSYTGSSGRSHTGHSGKF